MKKLIKKIRSTWLWRKKWKILLIGSGALAVLITSYYIAFPILAKKRLDEIISNYEELGGNASFDHYFPQDRPFSRDDDFLAHPFISKEINKEKGKGIGEIYGKLTGNVDFKKSSQPEMGLPDQFQYWLKKTNTEITSSEAAKLLLNEYEPFNNDMELIAQAAQRKNLWHHIPSDFSVEKDQKQNKQILKLFDPWDAFHVRARLYLASGNIEKANQDLNTLLQLATLTKNFKTIFGYFVHSAYLRSLPDIIWHGLKYQSWNDEQLVKIELALSELNSGHCLIPYFEQEIVLMLQRAKFYEENSNELKKQLQSSFIYRAKEQLGVLSFGDEFMRDHMPDLLPRECLLRYMSEDINLMIQHIIYSDGEKSNGIKEEHLENMTSYEHPFSIFNSASLGVSISSFVVGSAFQRYQQTSAALTNMRTAIALERYRLKNDSYPENLGQLVPEFLPSVPEDVITRKPLIYRIKEDGTPLFYSIGANEKDDGGLPKRDNYKGDWTWMYSPPENYTIDDYYDRN